MLGIYAIIEDGVVKGLTPWDPESEPDWTPPYGEAILTPEGSYINIGWTYDGVNFIEPPAPIKTDDEVITENTALKANLLASANAHISVLTDAVDPDIMGDDIDSNDELLLKAWRAYRVKLTKVTDMLNPVWPVSPDA